MLTNLEDVIRYHIQLPTYSNSNNFFSVLCRVCNDHGRKGNRAGFKFDSSGSVGYHCFNCGIKAKYCPSDNIPLSKKFKNILSCFGIKEEEYNFLYLNNIKNNIKSKPKSKEQINLIPNTIQLPSHFYKLSADNNDIWSLVAFEYLKNRKFNVNKYTFYLSTDKDWIGRLIIPIYKNSKDIIYYQGRKMDDSIPGQKYKSPQISKACIFFNYPEIFNFNNKPLFITEGFFDAFILNGVSILGNDFSKEQIQILNKCKRKKIYIPDKYGNGSLGAKQALNNNWSLALPEIGNCKDISESIIKYGEIYTVKNIMDNIYDGLLASVKLKFYTYD